MKILRFSIFCCLIVAAAATADGQKARIERLEASVLAPCCYHEPVSVHQSEIAMKMRIEIARWVADGRTDGEILATYVQQYGSKVLVDPRTRPEWWTPWIPWSVLIAAMGFGYWLLRQWRLKPAAGTILPARNQPAILPDFEDEE